MPAKRVAPGESLQQAVQTPAFDVSNGVGCEKEAFVMVSDWTPVEHYSKVNVHQSDVSLTNNSV